MWGAQTAILAHTQEREAKKRVLTFGKSLLRGDLVRFDCHPFFGPVGLSPLLRSLQLVNWPEAA